MRNLFVHFSKAKIILNASSEFEGFEKTFSTKLKDFICQIAIRKATIFINEVMKYVAISK